MTKLTEIEHLLRENYCSMYKASHRIVKDEQVAKDIVQDVFFQFWKLKNKNTVSDIESYLYKATVYHSINYVKKTEKNTKIESASTSLKSFSYHSFRSSFIKGLNKKFVRAVTEFPSKLQFSFLKDRYRRDSDRGVGLAAKATFKTVEHQVNMTLRKFRNDLPSYRKAEFVIAAMASSAHLVL